mgnify:CR=1 FL=1
MYKLEMIQYISDRILMIFDRNMYIYDIKILVNKISNQVVVSFYYNKNVKQTCECNSLYYYRLFEFKQPNYKLAADSIINKIIKQIDNIMNK